MPIPDEDDEKTRIIRKPRVEQEDDETREPERMGGGAAGESDEGEMTRLVRPVRREAAQEAPGAGESGGEADPVVGWLVVLAGPGRGNSVRLGYGQNSVGRDRDERCRIDFGDSSISRKRHCFVIYEPRKRQFVLRPGDSANLAYLNGELVSESRPLTAGSEIELGRTKLRFVPLCGPDFEWEDQTPTAQE